MVRSVIEAVGRRGVIGLAIVLLVLPFAAARVASQGLPTAAALDCAPAKRDAFLRKEQSTVLAKIGPLRTLRSKADLARLAGPPYNFVFPTHEFTSFRGIGLTIFDPIDPVRPGAPNFLFYAPNPKAKDATDPKGPDFPYQLIGWGYGVPYTPGRVPSFLPCIGNKDWHIHERGVHDERTGKMVVMPPAEAAFGDSAGTLADPPALRPVVGFPHARSWTAHLWLDPSGVAKSGILDPDEKPAGVDPGVGSSFYFLDDPPQGALERFANLARPFALEPGEGQPLPREGTTYTLKVASFQSGGAFTAMEVEFGPTSKAPTSGPIDRSEGYYVLEGNITFKAGGQTLPARKGSFVYMPEGTSYTLKVGSSGRAKALLIAVPGGLDQEVGFKEPGPPASAPSKPQEGAQLKPYVLQPDEGEVITFRGAKYVVKAGKKDTASEFSLMQIDMPQGAAPPPHIHHREIESFYLLDGQMTFASGGQSLPALGGSLVFLPLGLPHSYSVDTGTAHLLLLAVPSGLEDFFRALQEAGNQPLSARQAQRFGVEPVVPQAAAQGD
jgi:quercetin dioxygenase-like cupin family protein